MSPPSLMGILIRLPSGTWPTSTSPREITKGDFYLVPTQLCSACCEAWPPVGGMDWNPHLPFSGRTSGTVGGAAAQGREARPCLFGSIEHRTAHLDSLSSSFDACEARVWTLWFIRLELIHVAQVTQILTFPFQRSTDFHCVSAAWCGPPSVTVSLR